jgi:hypothetical protein
MPKAEKKLSAHSTLLVSASELAETVGIDLETINNWIQSIALQLEDDDSGVGCFRQMRFTKQHRRTS